MARIAEDRVIFAGGVNYLFNHVEDRVFELNLNTLKVSKLPHLINFRFFANIFYHKKQLFVVGGRAYGVEATSVLKECEQFNFEDRVWMPMASLNEPRCQAGQYTLNGKMFIVGGLGSQARALASIELYNEQLQRWELFGFNLPSPLMGVMAVPLDRDRVVFVGGMSGVDDQL